MERVGHGNSFKEEKRIDLIKGVLVVLGNLHYNSFNIFGNKQKTTHFHSVSCQPNTWKILISLDSRFPVPSNFPFI